MVVRKVDGVGLRKAIQRFGSLDQAIVTLQCTKAVLEKQVSQLNEEVGMQKSARDDLSSEIKVRKAIIAEQKEQQHLFSEQISDHKHQYELFQGFMTMLATSPSVDSPIKALISSLEKLAGPGWQLSGNREQMRSLFVQTVLGDYLKCFHCTRCGSRFIVNKCQNKRYLPSSYHCPVCQYSSGVKADDSFLKALVSQEQLEDTYLVEHLLEENTTLRPLQVFLNYPCDICGDPVNEWSEDSVARGVMGLGWGHTRCWDSTAGKLMTFSRIAKTFQEIKKQNPSVFK